jgi:head-tail adaptor
MPRSGDYNRVALFQRPKDPPDRSANGGHILEWLDYKYAWVKVEASGGGESTREGAVRGDRGLLVSMLHQGWEPDADWRLLIGLRVIEIEVVHDVSKGRQKELQMACREASPKRPLASYGPSLIEWGQGHFLAWR